MRPKTYAGTKLDGTFQSPFSPYKWGDAFTEGNSWHYTWSVFQDVEGLINLMGGKEYFIAKLDSVFEVPPIFDYSYYGQVIHEIREMQISNMGNYAHGNQPIQHMIYLYNYAGEPWKTQYRVGQVLDKLYNYTPDGIVVMKIMVRHLPGMYFLLLVFIRLHLVPMSMFLAHRYLIR